MLSLGHERLLDRSEDLNGSLEGRAHRQGDLDGELALVDLGQELAVEGQGDRDGDGERRKGKHRHAPRSIQRPSDGAGVGSVEKLEQGLRGVGGDRQQDPDDPVADRFEHPLHQERDDHQDNEEEASHDLEDGPQERPDDEIEYRRLLPDLCQPGKILPEARNAPRRDKNRQTPGLAVEAQPLSARQHRDEDQRHHQRREERDHHGKPEIAEGLTGDALDKDHGGKDRDRGQGRRDHGHSHFGDPAHRRGGGVVALLAAAEDGLENDDGRVDQHPDAQREPSEGHDVEADAEEVERGEGDQDRDRDRNRDDRGRPDVSQEQKEHDDREQTAEDGRVADLVDAVLDEDRPIGDQGETHAFGAVELLRKTESFFPGTPGPTTTGAASAALLAIVGADTCRLRCGGVKGPDPLFDPVGESDDVGVGLLEDLDLDAFTAVGTGRDLAFGVGPDDLAQITDPNLPALAKGDDGVADLSEIDELVEGPDHVLGPALAQGPAGNVDVLLGEPSDDIVGAQTRVAQTIGLEQNVDLLLETASHPDRRHSLDRFEGALDLELGEPAQPAQTFLTFKLDAVAGKTEFEDRIEGRVEAQNQGSFGLVRKKDQIELLQGVLDGFGHLDTPVELEDHIGDTGAADGRDPAQPADHPERLFDRSTDVVLDLLGRGARVLGPDREGRVAELGHERHRQTEEGEETKNDRGQKDHDDGDRSVDQE